MYVSHVNSKLQLKALSATCTVATVLQNVKCVRDVLLLKDHFLGFNQCVCNIIHK